MTKTAPRKAKVSAKGSNKRPQKKGAEEKADWLGQLKLDMWPQEKDVLFRPDRLRYVRKLLPPAGCVFCDSASKKPNFSSLTIKMTDHSMVLLNKYPYNSGHTLVIPKRHVSDLSLLSDEEYIDLMLLLRQTMAVAKRAYQCGGMNVGLNLGQVAGAGIPDHAHIHVIPRWAGDANFFPLIAESKVVIETLAQSYKHLLKVFRTKETSGVTNGV